MVSTVRGSLNVCVHYKKNIHVFVFLSYFSVSIRYCKVRFLLMIFSVAHVKTPSCSDERIEANALNCCPLLVHNGITRACLLDIFIWHSCRLRNLQKLCSDTRNTQYYFLVKKNDHFLQPLILQLQMKCKSCHSELQFTFVSESYFMKMQACWLILTKEIIYCIILGVLPSCHVFRYCVITLEKHKSLGGLFVTKQTRT